MGQPTYPTDGWDQGSRMTHPSPPAFADRVWIVTGANSGIGKATALGLARLDGTVVLACRNAERGEAAREEITRATGNEKISVMIVDMASQTSIRSFADEFRRTPDRLDALVNNAGIFRRHRHVTPDGLEETFAVNYLGGFLLTHLLLDLLKASAPSRVVNVSSSAHEGGRIHFDDLQGEARYSGFRAYGQSKLAQVLFTYELARRLEGTGVTVNACHPGVIRTNFGRDDWPWAVHLVRPFFKSPEKGAQTPVYLAASPEVAGLTGKYVVRKEPRASSRLSQDPELQRRLYDVSLELTGLRA
ncbi:MAG TPA: SDR family oxidoreductase [Thermoplasmata archaeon]|nr:SDR family oxidoreductase [Thermoplasmata archaeon]